MVVSEEDSAITVCGLTREESEDDEVSDGITAKLLNGTSLTYTRGAKLTNNGKIYVDSTSSFKICIDDYEGNEEDVYGEGEISFDCTEEPEVLPNKIVEDDPAATVENPATADNIFITLGVLGASMFGLFASARVLFKFERR